MQKKNTNKSLVLQINIEFSLRRMTTVGSYNFQALLGPKSIPNPSTNTLTHTQKKRKRKRNRKRKSTPNTKTKLHRQKEKIKTKSKRKRNERKIRQSGETCENDLKQRLRWDIWLTQNCNFCYWELMMIKVTCSIGVQCEPGSHKNKEDHHFSERKYEGTG